LNSIEPVQEILEIAEPAPLSRERSEQELERVKQKEEATMTELRVFLRDMLKVFLHIFHVLLMLKMYLIIMMLLKIQ
jgi:hypothetical protein